MKMCFTFRPTNCKIGLLLLARFDEEKIFYWRDKAGHEIDFILLERV